MKLWINLFWYCCLSLTVSAQSNPLKTANQSYQDGAYTAAIALYKKAFNHVRSIEDKAFVLYRVGSAYAAIAKPDQAEVWLKKAIKARYQGNDVHLLLAQSLKQQGKYAASIKAFKQYALASGKDQKHEVEACEQAQLWLDNPEKIEVEPTILLNSVHYDFAPAFAKGRNNNTVVFTSARDASEGDDADKITGEAFQDLYFSIRDNKGKWSEPMLLEGEVNTEAHEGVATFNKRKTQMFFTRCPSPDKNGLGCDIYTADRSGKNWNNVQKLPLRPEGADSISIGHPALSPDDQLLVFSSDREGGFGGKDLWYSVFDKKSKSWSAPENLGPHINTAGNEMFPSIRDNNQLTFASDGHPGMGGLDIFQADPAGFAEWKNVENLKAPINSCGNDYGLVYLPGETSGYLTSNRVGGRGKDDLYAFKQIVPLLVLEVNLIDEETNLPLANAPVEVIGSDQTTYKGVTNEEGLIVWDEQDEQRLIKAETTYRILGKADQYLASSAEISTVGIEESTRFIHELSLTPIIIDTLQAFPKVFYPVDEASLLVDAAVNSQDSLNFLLKILNENPQLVIELVAHTDTRGKPQNNLELSQRRAQTCVDYLIDQGIHPDRLQARGLGETMPLMSDETIENLQDQASKTLAHQANRRTEFKIIRDDFSLSPTAQPKIDQAVGQ